MSTGRMGARAALAFVAVLASALFMAAPSWAEAPTTICVPEAASSSVLSTNTKGECPSTKAGKTTVKYKSEALPGPAELEKLDKLLPHLNYVESGIGGKPTIQFSGVNVQVVNGEGTTATTNGAGNIVIGYDEHEPTRKQTGSHDLILGEGQQFFESYGGIVAGRFNSIQAPYASITGGEGSVANEQSSSVNGGIENYALGYGSSVSGGRGNAAFGHESSISGGWTNEAHALRSWIGGGNNNLIGEEGEQASIFGGQSNATATPYDAIP